jgi:hypothetical protein
LEILVRHRLAVEAVGGAGDKPEKLVVKGIALKGLSDKDAFYTWSNMKIDDGELGAQVIACGCATKATSIGRTATGTP